VTRTGNNVSIILAALIAEHAYWVVTVMVALESMGIPAPGETALVTAAIFAATTHRLNIALVIAAATSGAIIGDNIGYMLGQRFGYPLLTRYGRFTGMDARRIRLGRFLFKRHGGKVIFFGRFVALLRALAALLAGINQMEWRRFLFFNACGGTVWAAVFGLGGYVFGQTLERARQPVAVLGAALAVAAFIGAISWMRRHEAALQAEADRAFPETSPDP
jgi:membrane protein DedA with SNARE-associated domain